MDPVREWTHMGTRAQNRTPNTTRPLSRRFPSVEAELGYDILRQQQQDPQSSQVRESTPESRRQQRYSQSTNVIPTAPTPRRQEQDQQPTDLHGPTAQTPEPEPLHQPLPTEQPQDRRPSNIPAPVLQGERQQGPIPAPPEQRRQNELTRRQEQNSQSTHVDGPDAPAPRRQQQNPQPIDVDVPNAHTQQDPYPRLPTEELQVRPPSIVPGIGEQQQDPLPAPVPERQNEHITPRRPQQVPQPTVVPVPTAHAPEPLSPRSTGYQMRDSLPVPILQRQNQYTRFMRYLTNAAPSIHVTQAALKDASNRIITLWTNAESIWECVFKGLCNVAKFLRAQMTISKFFLILPFLVYWYSQQLVSIYICPSVNSFCSYLYNPLSPLICPVKICTPYPSNTATGVRQFSLCEEATPTHYNNTEQKEHIRTLFHIPGSMHWSAAG